MYVLSVLLALGYSTNLDVISCCHYDTYGRQCVFVFYQWHTDIPFTIGKQEAQDIFGYYNYKTSRFSRTPQYNYYYLLLHHLHGMDSHINLSLNRHMHNQIHIAINKMCFFFCFCPFLYVRHV